MDQMPTLQEHGTRGRNAVLAGDLENLRTKLGLTRSGMAELLAMSPITYTKCEQPEYAGKMNASTAERLGRFVWLAGLQLYDLEQLGHSLDEMMPLPMVATVTGLPQELLMKWHRSGAIATEDLGILGLWIYRSDLHLIGEVAGNS